MKVLVTGGAGYIGSHAVRELISGGHAVHVLDNLTAGHLEAVDPRAKFHMGSTGDFEFVRHLLESEKIEAVMHFAASIEVGESVSNPEKYFHNNLACTLTLLRAMRLIEVKKFIFSSTAAVYGNPSTAILSENHPLHPVNPYGSSKMMVEIALESYAKAYGLSYTILRYFNVAGAHPDGSIGEDHRPETHLIPKILMAAQRGEKISIYGADYPTPDGTCVRDYVHVCDLAHAHALALEYNGASDIFNLGSEAGFSVHQIIAASEQVIGIQIPMEVHARRPGDPPSLVASSEKIKKILKWRPERGDIKTILEDAWRWHSLHPNGY